MPITRRALVVGSALLGALSPRAHSQTATLVQTLQVWSLSPPSPDPAGIAYQASKDRLIVTDSEVNETFLFTGKNIFHLSRGGALLATSTTTAFSWEPTGIALDAATGRAYLTDDDQQRVFVVSPGPDGVHGTADDQVRWFHTDTFGSIDPEDVAFDPDAQELVIVDGMSDHVWRITRGPNGEFDGVPPEGDDTVQGFDTAALGITDPEGIAYGGGGELYVIGQPPDRLLHCTRQGVWLRTIDISAAGALKPAGMTFAPATQGGGQSLFVVDRGVDNDWDSSENDGHIYELALPAWSGGNAAPTVDAGPDASVFRADGAWLAGNASDDGLPNPPGWLTTTWSKVGGPGAVTFANPASPSTHADFTVAGTYVLRLSATDGAITSTDELTVQVHDGSGGGVVEVRVAKSADDAEESTSGSVSTGSSDLELVYDKGIQVVGMRFGGVAIPPGAAITQAWVQFEVDEVTSGATSLVVRAQAADDAPSFGGSWNVSSRAVTAASAAWSPAAWTGVGQAGAAQRTSDLSAVVQEVVSRAGWSSGNALVLLVRGSGERVASSYDGHAAGAPLLHVEFASGNLPPVVSAGPDRAVELPGVASLDGSVGDDGLPNPPGKVTTTWSKVSGPGTVTFGDAHQIDTTAAFSAAGTYVLRLEGWDGALAATDDVQVTVTAAGGGSVVEARITNGSDDAEERSTGSVVLNSPDLELVVDGWVTQKVGMRFVGLQIPKGATITKAWIQFRADESGSSTTSLVIEGHDTDDAPTFGGYGSVSNRTRTSAAVGWHPSAWTVGQAGSAQRTPDLAGIVQEIVDRPGWGAGNAMVFLFRGSGVRTAESFEGMPSGAALLHVEFE